MKNYLVGLLAFMFSLFGAPAFAIIDITAATTGVSDAQTAILSLLGALMAMAAALFGITMVYRFLNKKSGV